MSPTGKGPQGGAQAGRSLRVLGPGDDHGAEVSPRDEGAFFGRYAPYVARIGQRILGRDSELEDLVQDVFLAAFRQRGQLEDPGATRSWLATITVRKARHVLRKRRLRRMVGLGDGEALIVDRSASPHHRALLGRVYECLDGAPLEGRLAWTLRHVDGRKLTEVAELCGCSLATVKRRIAATHAFLQESLSDG